MSQVQSSAKTFTMGRRRSRSRDRDRRRRRRSTSSPSRSSSSSSGDDRRRQERRKQEELGDRLRRLTELDEGGSSSKKGFGVGAPMAGTSRSSASGHHGHSRGHEDNAYMAHRRSQREEISERGAIEVWGKSPQHSSGQT